jgi:hypothetical protein
MKVSLVLRALSLTGKYRHALVENKYYLSQVNTHLRTSSRNASERIYCVRAHQLLYMQIHPVAPALALSVEVEVAMRFFLA